MNPSLYLLRLPRGLAILTLLVLLSPLVVFSQSAAPAQKAIQRQAQADAKAHATRGDLAAAAQTLDALSTAPVGSSARHFETAQRLTLLASDLSRAGNAVGARAAAGSALQFLAQAERRTSDLDLKAAIQNQIGFLQERYLGDVASAKTAYRAAAQLAPANSAAREKADRFEQTDTNARRNAGGAR